MGVRGKSCMVVMVAGAWCVVRVMRWLHTRHCTSVSLCMWEKYLCDIRMGAHEVCVRRLCVYVTYLRMKCACGACVCMWRTSCACMWVCVCDCLIGACAWVLQQLPQFVVQIHCCETYPLLNNVRTSVTMADKLMLFLRKVLYSGRLCTTIVLKKGAPQ